MTDAQRVDTTYETVLDTDTLEHLLEVAKSQRNQYRLYGPAVAEYEKHWQMNVMWLAKTIWIATKRNPYTDDGWKELTT